MKKKYGFYIIFILVFMSGMMLIGETSAYSNGHYYTTDGSELSITKYLNDYKTAMYNGNSTHYSTHDWIAEYGLERCYYKYPSNQFFKKLAGWRNAKIGREELNDDDNCRIYYLLGTEIPDLCTYSSKDFTITTKCGTTISRTILGGININVDTDGDGILEPKALCHESQVKHRLRYGGTFTNYQVIVDNLLAWARTFFNYATEQLGNKDCQAAALYLGIVAHIIADATAYWHLIDIPPGTQKQTEAYIAQMTKIRYDSRISDPFISVPFDDGISTILRLDAESATRVCGKNAFFAPEWGNFLSPQEMQDNAPGSSDAKFWGLVGKEPHYWKSSDWSKFSEGSTPFKYFKTINMYLDESVKFVARMLKAASEFFTGCSDGEGQNNGDEDDLINNQWSIYTHVFTAITIPSGIIT